MSLPKIYTHIVDFDSEQIETMVNSGKFVTLSPDDILTLKLLKDEWRKEWVHSNLHKRRDVDLDQRIETLERILKQIQ